MKVVFAVTARLHLRSALRYIRLRSPQNAELVAERISSFLTLLGDAPRIGKPGREHGTREFLTPRTSMPLVYRVDDEQIQILAVVHKARHWRTLDNL